MRHRAIDNRCEVNSVDYRSTFFNQLLRNDRKLELDYEYACVDVSESARLVRSVVADYLEGYAMFNGISPMEAIASYGGVVRRYVSDIRAFVETNKYPIELIANQPALSRSDYDLFLMLTILSTKHRCAVMEEILQFPATGKVLVLGVGSGVELALIGANADGDAYDLYINPFARSAFPTWHFCENLYQPIGQHYDSVYAIELLEHLDQPYAFLADCHASLAPGGRLLVTTATNVPQFDHRFNFASDDEFEQRAGAVGFVVEHKRIIPHAYPRTEIGARNVFYSLTRVV